MKKATVKLLISLLAGVLLLCGCENTPADETDTDAAVQTEAATEAATEPETEAETEPEVPVIEEDVNAESISIKKQLGLNEQIYIQLTKTEAMKADPEKMDFKVSYRAMDKARFTELDKELYLDEGDYIGCYILGLPEGNYCVKIEQGEGDSYARTTLLDINVERQDRSGYAYFNREEGIGGYNKDGSVKENAVILYLNNANKNTLTLEIDGKTYTGFVEILQAKQYMEVPLIIRVTDKVTTNQWMPREFVPRYADNSNFDEEEFWSNPFSTEAGENLAGLPVFLCDAKEGKTYSYTTTTEGLTERRVGGYARETKVLGSSDRFGAEYVGKEVYADDDGLNYLDASYVTDLTIEGVGTEAEFYQFGIRFVYPNSIEVRNMIFSQYPADALGFYAVDDNRDTTLYGNCWIHNNTFNAGYTAWHLKTSQSQQRGDGALDMSFVHNMTASYNMFKGCDKTMLIGSEEWAACQDITLHHNYFDSCSYRLPRVTNSNVHGYNNFYSNCNSHIELYGTTNYFSEYSWFTGGSGQWYLDLNGVTLKAYKDTYEWLGDVATWGVVLAEDREQAIENNQCSPDGVTDYSKFDTDPALFYYDAENKCSDVEFLLDTSDRESNSAIRYAERQIRKYAGAGNQNRLELPDKTAE
ncbi:MAG: hypothetical protein IJ325_00410 [Clostridia bacterium]|nr:hypothetical protein [Clostridia bacterium]